MLPNVVIVGVPKCGTTSVFSYLADHPEVCQSKEKETYYLMDKGHPLFKPSCNYAKQGMVGYATFFNDCSGREAVVMEATPDYFYQDTAFRVLSEMDPRPLIVFMLREPSERVFSLFKFAKNNIGLLTAQYTFSQFIDDLLLRDGEQFTGRPILRNAVEHGKYDQHIRRWLDTFTEQGTAFFLFEELVSQPAVLMRKIGERLGIAATFYDEYEFATKNPTYEVRSIRLQRLKKRVIDAGLAEKIKPLLIPLYRRLNIRAGRVKKTPQDIETLRRLKALYSEHNARLSTLTGIDTSFWLDGEASVQTSSISLNDEE